MTATSLRGVVSVRDYLAGELESPVKHEYVGGRVYAMASLSNVHNQIAGNVLAFSHGRLRGQHWPFNSDTKIRIRMATQTCFYYPDISIVCRPNSPHESFQDEPAVIFEVLSKSTRRIDEGEKKDAYLTIPSLGVYLLIEQDRPLVTVHRRTESGFVREVYDGLGAIIPLGEIDIELPLAEIYTGVEFTPEPGDEDEA